MSKTEPSSLGKGPKEQAEHPNGGSGVLGQTATALGVLSCFDDSSVDDPRSTRCADEIAHTTGGSREDVDAQIARLIRLCYLERSSKDHYRLSRPMLGEAEIVAVSIHNSRTPSHGRARGDEGTSSTPP